MKIALLIFSLAVTLSSQTRLGRCGDSPASAANTVSPGAGPDSFAAKPDSSRAAARLVLPQIQYRRPPGPPGRSCWCGTVTAGSLISDGLSQEMLMISGLGGNFRFDHVMIQESKQFSSDTVSSLLVSAGRPNSAGDLITNFALKSPIAPQNFVSEIPDPPVLAGTYSLVLRFVGTSPLAIGGSSNFASGAVIWEVCGHQVRP